MTDTLAASLRRASRALGEFLRPDTAPDRSIPTLDGGFAPNDELQKAPTLTRLERPQDVVAADAHHVVVSAGNGLYLVDIRDSTRRRLVQFEGDVMGLSLHGSEVLACVQGAGLFAYDMHDGTSRAVATASEGPLTNLSEVAVVGDRVFVAQPSDRYPAADWPQDFIRKRSTGSVFELDGTSLTEIAGGLAWVGGLAAHDGSLLVSETWAHRVVQLDPATGRTTMFRDRLPGYPARVSIAGETILLAVFALRTHLVEFVLREVEFRRRMIEQVPVQEWIRPAYRSTNSVREPFQLGSVVHLGVAKPWGRHVLMGWSWNWIGTERCVTACTLVQVEPNMASPRPSSSARPS